MIIVLSGKVYKNTPTFQSVIYIWGTTDCPFHQIFWQIKYCHFNIKERRECSVYNIVSVVYTIKTVNWNSELKQRCKCSVRSQLTSSVKS